MSGSRAILVFVHAHIFLAVEGILNLPVVPNCLSRPRWRQLVPVSVGDGIDGFVGGQPRAMVEAFTLHLKYLSNLGIGVYLFVQSSLGRSFERP